MRRGEDAPPYALRLPLKGKAKAAFLFFLQYRVTGKPHSGHTPPSIFVPHLGQVIFFSSLYSIAFFTNS